MSIEINITENIVEVTPNEQQVDINITENPIEVNVTDEIVLIQQTGLQGPAGPGVPIGGTTGQILAKNSATNYDTLWINNAVGTVTSIATTAPITGGTITTTGTIGITQASASGDGYLSSTDWNTFNNKQNALTNPITGTGTVNYVPKFTAASALADSNIQDSGSLITLGTALQATSTAIFNNSMALGTALQANSLFFLSKALGGNTFAQAINISSPVSSAVTALARYFNASTSTEAGFTLTELINYNARQGTFLSPVVDQIGFNVESTMSGATNNYAFRGNINSAANSWNFYANGTALNFMRGALLVGSSVDDTINKLQITGSAIVSSSITANSFIKSGGTSAQILAADGSVITAGTNITISGGTISAAGSGGTVTSVGLTMPAAFAVANSPITGAGTLAVTAIGTSSQYIRGDGSLATIPSTSSGGSSVNYYLNGSVAASVAGYQQMANSAIIGTGTDFTLVGNGLIAQFLTDVANPNRLLIPGGAWNFEMYFNISSSGGNTKFYVELLKYNGTTFTSIASSSAVAEEITGGTTIDLYVTSLAVPETILLATDRLAVRVYIVDNSGGRTVTLHTEDNTLCEIITTFAGGIAALNGLTANTQYFATGTSGTDFNILSATDTHTFNLPTASASNRGALSSADWTTFNGKYTLPSLTSGSVLFSNGTTIAQDNANFFWDDTNNRLGIGTATPTTTLDITGTFKVSGAATLSSSLGVTGVTTLTDIAAIGTAVTQNNLNINRAITGAVTANGIQITSQVGGTVTTAARYFSAIASTAAGTLTDLFNFRAAQGTFTGTVTNQYGYFVDATLIGATNNYGFRGAIPAAANRWNLYMDGTAINYLNGALLVGSATDDTINKLQVTGTTKLAGATTISTGNFIVSAGNSAFNTTIPSPLFASAQWTFFGTSGILESNSTQVKFVIRNNCYYNGTVEVRKAAGFAQILALELDGSFAFVTGGTGALGSTITFTKHLQLFNNGNLVLQNGGTFTDIASARLQISSTTQGFLPPRMTTTQKNAIASPAAGLIVYDTTLRSTSVYDGSTWINDTITTNRQAASYSLVLTDRGKLVEMNVATANNLTVPLNSSIAFPIGTKIDLSQYGAGQTTVVATGGVTIRSAGGALKLALQYSGASLVKIATDEWYLFGDITV